MNLRGDGKLSPEDMEAALREGRVALLEDDVQFRVAKQFIEAVKEKAMGSEVLTGLSPTQAGGQDCSRRDAQDARSASGEAANRASATARVIASRFRRRLLG